jgi:hypothetical protein
MNQAAWRDAMPEMSRIYMQAIITTLLTLPASAACNVEKPADMVKPHVNIRQQGESMWMRPASGCIRKGCLQL